MIDVVDAFSLKIQLNIIDWGIINLILINNLIISASESVVSEDRDS